MSRRACVVIALALIGVGCGELPGDTETTRGAALVSSKQYISVSAYWDATRMATDFDTLSQWDGGNSRGAIKSVVVNLGCEYDGGWVDGRCTAQSGQRLVAGGPGSGADPALDSRIQALAAKIAALQADGIEVYGYIDFYANRPTQDIGNDLYAWGLFLGYDYNVWLDGIFFDDADRTSSVGLARAEYWANAARQFLGGKRVIFNYGVNNSVVGQFVACLANYQGAFNWFVTEEHSMSTYQGISVVDEFGPTGNSRWMAGYMPDHFINIVHDVPTNVMQSTVQDLINESWHLNAGQIYIKETENDGNGTYGRLAQNSVEEPGTTSPIFDWVDNASATTTAQYDHGGTIDPPQANCVAEDQNAPE